MQQRRIIFLSPRFPWWGWIFLLPLAVLGIFLGAVFFLVFIAFVVTAGLVMWIRWKWLRYKMGGKGGPTVHREFQTRSRYDYEIKRLDEPNNRPRKGPTDESRGRPKQ
ncbi:hypothetical protein [Desulfonatronum thioautotrophicum]|uniref:hypothetical protein n=1 Tax=Desulfonatronum thioautotrophicum TaxID=617001 RepID=UPI001294664B|nr:hypothetical protein [Desulfonatronum thioautotrophicum]